MACNRRLVSWVLLGLLGAGVFGCEVIAKVDRGDIPEEVAGAGGSAGHDGGGAGGTAGKDGGGTGGIAGQDGGDAAGGKGGGKGGSDAGGAAGKDAGGAAGTDAGGTGGAPECTVPGDCPTTANECITRTCVSSKCGTENVASGTNTTTQTAGDCKVSQCDGNGAIAQANDDTDLPVDNIECTDDVCTAGSPTNPPKAKGTTCGTGLICDGNGACTGCTLASECPGVDDDCKTRKCDNSVCSFEFAASGKVITAQVAGDCQSKQCDGAGVVLDVNDDTDLPVDNKECTDDICQSGVPSNPDSAAGKSCTENGGSYCSGTGNCVECVGPSTCPGQDTDCKKRSCTSHVCGFTDVAAGTKLPDPQQVTGDCQVKQCDGFGAVSSAKDDADLPVDNKDCTDDVCTNGVPSNPPKSSGTVCGANLQCDAAGNCVGCLTEADCTGTNTECKTKKCASGTCGWDYAASGTALASQTAGDCKVKQCDGAGNTEEVDNNLDVPVDASDCTDNVCTVGVPSNPPKQSGTTCNTSGGSVCDATGACVQCLQANTCSGTDTDCHTRTCTAGVCGFSNAASGKPLTAQTDGDCQLAECDGNGGVKSVADNTDKPVDGNLCTDDVCTAGVPSNPPVASGTSCGAPKICDANGNCVGCVVAGDCAGTDTECRTRKCTTGVCGFDYTANGTKVSAQTPKDCKADVCNGAGAVITVNDDLDLPVDNLECTSDVCTAGVPTNPPVAINTSCTAGGSFCNATGQCVQCNAPTQCTGTDTECHARTCASGSCGVSNMNVGTVTSSQTAGDCHQNQCDGNGAIENVILNSDVLVDANQCTDNICTAGVPSNPNSPLNTGCAQNGGTFCNGGGACVQCNAAGQCAGTDTECHQRTCNSNTCGVFNTLVGTATSSQTAGDCHKNQCDGNGNITSAIDDTDLPVDGNQCTDDICTGGAVSNPPTPSGAACTSGGNFCNGAGACVQCVAETTCPVAPNECQLRACVSWICGFSNVGVGTATSSQVAGDCKQNQCDGNGAVVNVAFNTDVPVDGNQCTNDVCTAGVGSNPPAAAGTACTQGGGIACDGNGNCVVAPEVASTTPADGGSGIASTTVSVTFNQAMNPATLTGQTAAGACSGSIQVSLDNFATCIAFLAAAPAMSGGNTIATLTPAPGLLVNRTYQVRVTTAATGASTQTLVSQYTSATGFGTTSPNLCDGSLVMSQVYGGGGNSGAVYKNDFVELHNRGTTTVSLAGLSLQYTATNGTVWNSSGQGIVLLSGSIPAGGYFLVQLGAGAGGTTDLPAPDLVPSIALALGANNGKIALINGTTQIPDGNCPPPAQTIDFVGYGTATCWEGAGKVSALANTTSAQRLGAGCADVNNNVADFAVLTAAPRNGATPAAVCACVVQNESNAALEADFCNVQFPLGFSVQTGLATPTIYGRLYESGTTEAAGAAANVRAQVGYGPFNANPQYQAGWNWTNAAFNVQVGNDDEYDATFTAPIAGTYAYVYRFSLDNGVSWTLCDDATGAGSNAGLSFDLANMQTMTVTP